MRHPALLVVVVVLSLACPALAADPSVRPAVTVHDALVDAVRQRFGAHTMAVVTLTDVRTDVSDGIDLVAVPDPGARTGSQIQFALRAGARFLGTAVARVRVETSHVRATEPLSRDTAIAAGQVEAVEGEVTGVRLEPLPRLDDVVGAQARRAVAAGEVLSHSVVIVPEAVRAGDMVRVVARVGVLEAWGVGRASGSGRVGDVVRITRGEARGLQRARVVAPGVVQVLLHDSQEIR